MPALSSTPGRNTRRGQRPLGVRTGLLVALALSLLLHLAWTLWPVESTTVPEATVLTATLKEMPPPPVPRAEPPPSVVPEVVPKLEPRAQPLPTVQSPRVPKVRANHKRPPAPPVLAAPAITAAPDALPPPAADLPALAGEQGGSANGAESAATSALSDAAGSASPEAPAMPQVVLPPRVDLAYKVFLGTEGFMIGDATYRFEHSGDRYRISTVGQARGLAALLVRGTGKIESRGRITSNGLRPYEFAVERGGPDRREVAFFDWDARNVVLHDGSRAQLEPPAFDPLTILWQPYFSPPGKGDQTFSLATTRKVARYTLSLQAEETIAWPRGEIATERWHRRSDDGKTEAWLWLAPSMHYIPIKMRITRTARGTLEVLLDSIRVDETDATESVAGAMAANEAPRAGTAHAIPDTVSDITYGMPSSPMAPLRADDLHGQ